MKKLLILLLLIPTITFAQSEELMDSVNHYFGILLNNERDSINRVNSKNPNFVPLSRVTVESDRSKFVNPDKHLLKTISDIIKTRTYTPHSTTNKENFLAVNYLFDITSEYQDPKKVANEFFMVWKNSPKHYDFMVNGGTWSNNPYQTFVVRYKMVYDKEFILSATFTVFQ